MVDVVNFRMVRLAREMRGHTQTALAQRAGISQAHLSRIEGGLLNTAPHELHRLAQALELPAMFFTEPDTPTVAPLFRKRAIRSVRRAHAIQARINVAVLAARRILDAGVEVDAPHVFPSPGEFDSKDPYEVAMRLRRRWRVPNGRVENITGLIESAGGLVLHMDFGSDDASAAFVCSLGDPRLWFLVNTREQAGDRVRLSLAHELGHALMHRYLHAPEEHRVEADAYTFACALLLPREEFDAQVPSDLSLRRTRDLKRAYRVSIQAIMRASRDRGLITHERYVSLYKQVSARGWRREEPEHIAVEQPHTWAAALGVHRDTHRLDDDDLAQLARVTRQDLRDLFPWDFRPALKALSGTTPPASSDLAPPFLRTV